MRIVVCKLWQYLAEALAACRQIAGLKALLETQTKLNDSLQQDLQQREAMVSQVGVPHASFLTPTLPLQLLHINDPDTAAVVSFHMYAHTCLSLAVLGPPQGWGALLS